MTKISTLDMILCILANYRHGIKAILRVFGSGCRSFWPPPACHTKVTNFELKMSGSFALVLVLVFAEMCTISTLDLSSTWTTASKSR